MKLSFDNLVVHVEDATDGEHAWLFDYLSFTDGTQVFRGKVKRFRVYNMVTNTFPSGLLGSVVREWQRLRKLEPCRRCNGERMIGFNACPACEKIEIRPKWIDRLALVDKRQRPCDVDASADLDWLFWYQREAVDAASSRARGIIEIPTAGGKTEVFVALTRAVPCRWLFIAHRAQLMINGAKRWIKRERDRLDREIEKLRAIDELMAQVEADELEDAYLRVRVGMFGDGQDTVRPDDRVVFATFQGLHASLHGRGREILEAAQAVCIDECHVQPADTFFAVTQAARNAFYRIGLSGTPLQRGDKRNVLAIGALGKIVYRIRIKTLIDEGRYATPIIRFVTVAGGDDIPKPSKCTKCDGLGEAKEEITGDTMPCATCKGSGLVAPKYPTVYKHGVIMSKKRNAAIVQIAKRAAKPCILFVEKRDHGKILKREIEKAGVTVRFVDGTKNTDQREKAIKDLGRGHIDMLITTRIMQEGIDLPAIASVINAGAGKSMIGVLQRVGRGARTTSEKTTIEIWDIFDSDHVSLRRQSTARRKALVDKTECPAETIPLGAPLPFLG